MHDFFIKKKVFFVCFLSCIFFIFILTAYHNKGMQAIVDKVKKELEGTDVLQSGSIFVSVEEILQDEVSDYVNLKESYGFFHKLLGKKAIDNFSYIKGDDGMIYYGTLLQGREEMLPLAKRVKGAMIEADKKGAKTLFVMLPSKNLHGLSVTESEFMINDKNGVQDEMLLSMQYCEVPALDLRKTMIESGYPINKLFYKTDNTWTTEAAFLATVAIVEEIRVKFGDNWDPKGEYINLDNYVSIVYKDATVGRFGSTIGVAYTGKDDFSVLYPKFDTEMEWHNLEKDKRTEGDFKDTFLTLDFDLNGDIYEDPASDLYLSGITDRDRIVNRNNPNGPKILCLRDGNFSAVASFLAPMCSQIDLAYTRSPGTNIDYEKLIIEEDYDYLIIVGNPYNLDESNFNYFQE